MSNYTALNLFKSLSKAISVQHGKGWPTAMPTHSEAQLLAEVRLEIGQIVGLSMKCTDADSVLDRYETLIAQRLAKTPEVPVKLMASNSVPGQIGLGF